MQSSRVGRWVYRVLPNMTGRLHRHGGEGRDLFEKAQGSKKAPGVLSPEPRTPDAEKKTRAILRLAAAQKHNEVMCAKDAPNQYRSLAPLEDYADLTVPGVKVARVVAMGPYSVAIQQAQGGSRKSLEDATAVHWYDDINLGVVGVCDGHGGDWAATKVAAILPDTIHEHVRCLSQQERRDKGAVRTALKNAFAPADVRDNLVVAIVPLRKNGERKPKAPSGLLSLQEKLTNCVKSAAEENSGTTACVAVILENVLYVANVGDSRAVLVDRNGKAQRLSVDQKVCNAIDKLESRGNKLKFAENDVVYVCNVDNSRFMNIARSLGDFSFPISRRPQVSCIDLHATGGSHLLLGSDGIFDVTHDDILATYIHQGLAEGGSLNDIANDLLKISYGRCSHDHLTAILLPLRTVQNPS